MRDPIQKLKRVVAVTQVEECLRAFKTRVQTKSCQIKERKLTRELLEDAKELL
jgi:hypothetical protein